MMPSQARPVAPQPGSRWPAPVAPAWQAPADQHPGPSEPQAAAQAYGPYEPPDEPPSWPGYQQPAQLPGPPPLPQQTVAPPPLPPPPHWADGAGPGGAVQSAPWPETEVQGHDYGPAPEAWPPAPQPSTYGPANSGAPWPDTHWPPPAPQLVPDTMANQPAPAPEVPALPALGREVPQAADGPTTGGRPGRKRKSAERAVAGQMVENIPRRMRAHVPIDVDVRIAKSEFRALADGLAGAGEPHTHGVQVTPAMSVRLRAPDGGFVIDSAAPETQWLESRLGQIETDFASWRWTVTPLKSGRRRLQLVVSARTSSSGGTAGETPLPEQVIDIAVATNWGRATARAMTWALFALAGGLIAKFGNALYDPLIAAVLKAIK
jgi:neural Wiskott-Aldrich syndrome protein